MNYPGLTRLPRSDNDPENAVNYLSDRTFDPLSFDPTGLRHPSNPGRFATHFECSPYGPVTDGLRPYKVTIYFTPSGLE